jgi:hypothetical protein
MAKKDKNTIDLPEVTDIPGQEHVRPPRLGELADTTASSADEEGDDVLNPVDEEVPERSEGNEREGTWRSSPAEALALGNEGNVTADERSTLANIDRRRADSEDEVLRESALDTVDDDGDPLNEKGLNSDEAGDDLDVPGSEDDDADEELGEEDEENNDYSLSDNDDEPED